MLRISQSLAAFASLCASPAIACDCVRLVPGSANFDADLNRIAKFYPVAGDGVLEHDGPYGWRFTPTREFRGTGAKSYRIVLASDCSLDPAAMDAKIGRPVFLLLSPASSQNDAGAYEAQRCVNWLGTPADAALRHRVMERCKSK